MSSPPGISSYLKAASESESEGLEEHQEIVRVIEELDLLFQLMSECRVLGFKPDPRLEWRGQNGQDEAKERYIVR